MIPGHVREQIISCCDRANPWLAYKLARQALRFGQCAIAEIVFNTLAQKVSKNKFKLKCRALMKVIVIPGLWKTFIREN